MRVLTDKELQTQLTDGRNQRLRSRVPYGTTHFKVNPEQESTQRNYNINLRKLETICYRTP